MNKKQISQKFLSFNYCKKLNKKEDTPYYWLNIPGFNQLIITKDQLDRSLEKSTDIEYYSAIEKEGFDMSIFKKTPQSKFPEIVLPNKGIKGHNPYTFAFVYAEKGNILVKGYLQEVQEYLKNFNQKYFVNYTFYRGGVHRGYWKFYKKEVVIFEPETGRFGLKNRKKFEIRGYSNFENYEKVPVINLKRMPHKWIPEFNVF